jgi:methyl-accepting chemotaxis protein
VRKRFRNLAVGTRLGLAFGVVCALLVAVAVTGVIGARRQSAVLTEIVRLHALSAQIWRLNYLNTDVSGWEGYTHDDAMVIGGPKAAAPDFGDRKGLAADKEEVYKLLTQIDTGAMTESERAEMAQQRALWDAFFAADQAFVDQLKTGTKEGLDAAYDMLANQLSDPWNKLKTSTDKIIESIRSRILKLVKQAHDIGTLVEQAVLVVAGLALLLAVLLSRAVTRSVTRPLRHCVAVLRQVRDGDLAAETALRTKDETGQLGTAIDEMTGQLRETVAAVAETATTVGRASQGLAETSRALDADARDTVQRSDLAAQAAANISAHAGSVATGSSQMDAAIAEIATSASNAARVAADAVREVKTTTGTVAQLGESSSQIGDVVKVITSIAEQTNLLALNATIEAARAGDAGKGFAVVAGEVKDLAQETAKATDDITRRVAAIQADTGSAVHAIEQIRQVVTQISEYQTTIAAAVEEQSATSRSMSDSIGQAVQSSTQIAGAVEDVAAAADRTTHRVQDARQAATSMAEMSDQLRTLVGRFRH